MVWALAGRRFRGELVSHSRTSYHRQDIDGREAHVFGRLIEIEGVDPSKREEVLGDDPGEDHPRTQGD